MPGWMTVGNMANQKWSYRIRPDYHTCLGYKRTVKQFRSLQITANVLLPTSL